MSSSSAANTPVVSIDEAERIFREEILPATYEGLSGRDRYIVEQLTQRVRELCPSVRCLEIKMGADRQGAMTPATRTEIRFFISESDHHGQLVRPLADGLKVVGSTPDSLFVDLGRQAYRRDVGSVEGYHSYTITLTDNPHTLFCRLAALDTAIRVGYDHYRETETKRGRGL